MILCEGNMKFDFTGFNAEKIDTAQNACTGLGIVDFVAENEECILFIEVKNYDNFSDDPIKQAHMDKNKENDYLKLTEESDSYPRKVGMVFKDSLFRWLAQGKEFTKPIKLLYIINPMPEFEPNDHAKLLDRIEGYIPHGINTKLSQYPKMHEIKFDMPMLENVKELYNFTVTLKRG